MNKIPDEVLGHVFSFLPVSDLLTMRKVSVRHGRVARDKQLWRWTRIEGMEVYRDKKYFTGKGTRTRNKIASLGDITVDEYSWIVCRVGAGRVDRNMSTEHVEEILNHVIHEREEELETGEKIVQLKELDMKWISLSGVDDQLLARAVVKVKTVSLEGTRQTTVQWTTLLQTILAEKELVMESLDMSHNNLGGVDDQLLARAVVRMKIKDLNNTCLTTVQATTLLPVSYTHLTLPTKA